GSRSPNGVGGTNLLDNRLDQDSTPVSAYSCLSAITHVARNSCPVAMSSAYLSAISTACLPDLGMSSHTARQKPHMYSRNCRCLLGFRSGSNQVARSRERALPSSNCRSRFGSVQSRRSASVMVNPQAFAACAAYPLLAAWSSGVYLLAARLGQARACARP